MKRRNGFIANLRWSPLAVAVALACAGTGVRAQDQDDATELEKIEVTGSRIKRSEVEGVAPVLTLERKDLDRTGLGTVGDILQQLTASGKALNSKFNSSGNFGFPPEGGGIGAGSSQVDLRNLGSQRVLVLVDGRRWVNESSGSGVGGSVDLNTIPLAIVERIEVLNDGASAIYGSDAIAGVINVITRKEYEGAEVMGYYGEYDEGDGETTQGSVTVGGGNDRFNAVVTASYYEQKRISSADREISFQPFPFDDPALAQAFGSSRGLTGRFQFCDPRITPMCRPQDFLNLTVIPGTTTPVYNPANPTGPGSTYRVFSGADRFNYAPFNLVLTPSERKSLFASTRYQITDNVSWYMRGLYNERESKNQAAPEPIVLGPANGSGTLSDSIFISRLNPFNPFGIDLDPTFNFNNLGRRPVEAGPRIFVQDVDTFYFNTGIEGTFGWGERLFSWDVNYIKSENEAEQQFFNGFNLRRMALALGDPAICAQNPGCVPLNVFGVAGTITPEMLNWVRFTTKDSSKQELEVFSANVTGDVFELPAGPLGFAAGYEFRDYSGSYTPDQARTVGESQDSAAVPTSGSYDVNELYAEFNVPLFTGLELSVAGRYSDYSNFGDETTGKFGLRWQPFDDLILRATYAEGFRAPFIGELFGLAQFGASITDPCGPIGQPIVVNDADGPNTTPTETNCRALGVPSGYQAVDTQITTTTGGNPNLGPESSDNFTAGFVYSPSWGEDASWARRLDFEFSYYDYEIDDAIQAPDAQDRLDACVASGDANSVFCTGIVRNPSGNINRFANLLANIGKIETDGIDFGVNWLLPEWEYGGFGFSFNATYVADYTATDVFGNTFSRTVGVEVNDSAIPEWQANLLTNYAIGRFSASWMVRYIDGVDENCADFEGLGVCSDEANLTNHLGSTVYNDFQFNYDMGDHIEGLRLTAGINNAFDKDPPKCFTCTLNGYDAGTYDVPGQFYYFQANYKF